MNTAVALKRAQQFLARGFAPGICSLDADGNPVLEWRDARIARWCVDDALMAGAEGNAEVAGDAYAVLSDVAGGGSAVLSWDEALGYCVDRPESEVLRLVAMAATRAAVAARRAA